MSDRHAALLEVIGTLLKLDPPDEALEEVVAVLSRATARAAESAVQQQQQPGHRPSVDAMDEYLSANSPKRLACIRNVRGDKIGQVG